MLTDEEVDKLREAGRIASEVRRWVENYVKEEMKVIDVCEAVEAEIRKKGGQPAFPCNVDINDVGAHYTSPPNDESIIPKNSIVKIDLGVHVDGYIADTATSLCFNHEYLNLKEAVEAALEEAIKTIKVGVKVSTVGAAVQNVIEGYGLKPIRNLTGHGMSRFSLHDGVHIPNVGFMDGSRLREREVYALEPFATTQKGAGEVGEYGIGFIYRVSKGKLPKDLETRRLLEVLKRNFYPLPFALRWVVKVSPIKNFQPVFDRLLQERYVWGYPLLVEKNIQPIAQSEHTIIVFRDGVEVTTL